MRILIVGGGVVGTNLATQLSREGHDISIVDRNSKLISRLSDQHDLLGVVGDATSPAILRKAGIETSEMLIAVTDNDEVNLVLCMIADKFGVESKIARMRNQGYIQDEPILNPEELGIDLVVNPEIVIVNKIEQLIETPSATEVAEFGDGNILLRAFHLDEDTPIAGKRLMDLREMEEMDSFLIVAITRNDEVIIPTGNVTLQADDTIYVMISASTLPLVVPLISRRVKPIEHVVIFGASRTGVALAKQLVLRNIKPILIDPNAERAEYAATEVPKARVLVGEGADTETLLDAGIENADLFVAISDDDEVNLLSGLLARKLGAARNVVQTEDPDYVPILGSIGLDRVVNPRLITVSEILGLIRRGNVRQVFKVHEKGAEVIEMEPVPGSKVVGRPLREVNFPEGTILGAVIRNGEMLIPSGNTVVQEGERVIVFALPEAIPKVEKLFARKSLFA